MTSSRKLAASPLTRGGILTGLMLAACMNPAHAKFQSKSGVSINPPTLPRTAPMTSGERKNLGVVLDWWREVIEAHHTELAARYQTEDYIQHDPNVPTGRAAFVKAFSNVAPTRPMRARLARPPVIKGAKGDFVWLVFENVTNDPRDPKTTFYYNNFDILRIEKGKIAEHWDSSTKRPGSPDFVLSTAPAPSIWNTGKLSREEQRNLAVATEELKDILQYGHLDLADTIIAPGYVQHNPNVPQGREGFKRVMARPAGTPVEAIAPAWKSAPALTLAQGPYVLMMWNWKAKDPADPAKTYVRNHFDLLRIENDQSQEHWDEARIMPAPPR